jgi:hypothetical protein
MPTKLDNGNWECAFCNADFYHKSEAEEHEAECSYNEISNIKKRLDKIEEVLETIEKENPMKPCEIPCPKCGSLDIARNFVQRGEHFSIIPKHLERFLDWPSKLSEDITPPKLPGSIPRVYYCKAIYSLFTHSCRVCGWYWETPFEGNPVESTKA